MAMSDNEYRWTAAEIIAHLKQMGVPVDISKEAAVSDALDHLPADFAAKSGMDAGVLLNFLFARIARHVKAIHGGIG